jgi:hypothetical protein
MYHVPGCFPFPSLFGKLIYISLMTDLKLHVFIMRVIADKDESWEKTIKDAFFCISCCFRRKEE